jgi:Ca-activated chloride channel family protein
MELPTVRPWSLVALLLLMAGHELYGQTVTPAAFRSNTQMVLVPTSVVDHSGKTVIGLRPQDFTVFDDDLPQQIAAFTNEDAPCSVGLVFDASGSMRNTIGFTKDLAKAFFQASNPQDEFFLLTVSTTPEAISGFTTDTEALEKNIELTNSGGMTALIDTVYLALSRMRGARQPRRAMLIISDGMDNNSRYSKGDLMRVALEADVQIYSIVVDGIVSGFGNGVPFRPGLAAKPIDVARERQGPQMLEEIAEKTGGLHFHASNNPEAREAMIKVGQAIRNEYVLAYQPPQSSDVGKWHRIRVKSHAPKVKVYARSGYYSQ